MERPTLCGRQTPTKPKSNWWRKSASLPSRSSVAGRRWRKRSHAFDSSPGLSCSTAMSSARCASFFHFHLKLFQWIIASFDCNFALSDRRLWLYYKCCLFLCLSLSMPVCVCPSVCLSVHCLCVSSASQSACLCVSLYVCFTICTHIPTWLSLRAQPGKTLRGMRISVADWLQEQTRLSWSAGRSVQTAENLKIEK